MAGTISLMWQSERNPVFQVEAVVAAGPEAAKMVIQRQFGQVDEHHSFSPPLQYVSVGS